MKYWMQLMLCALLLGLHNQCQLVSAENVTSVAKKNVSSVAKENVSLIAKENVSSVAKEIERIQKKADEEAVEINKKAHAEMNLMRQETNEMLNDLREQERNAIIDIKQTEKDLQYEMEEAERNRREVERKAQEKIEAAKEKAKRLRQLSRENMYKKIAKVAAEAKKNNVSHVRKEGLLRRAKATQLEVSREVERIEREAKRIEEMAARQALLEIERANSLKRSTIELAKRDSMRRIRKAENTKLRVNVWVQNVVNRSMHQTKRRVDLMERSIQRSLQQANALKLILLFAEKQLNKALEHGVKGSYETSDIILNSMFLGNCEITVAKIKLSNGYDLLFTNFTGLTHRVVIKGRDINGSAYFHDKEFTIVNKKIFKTEKFYDAASQNLTIKSEESPYLIKTAKKFGPFKSTSSAVSLGEGLCFDFKTFVDGKESILLTMGQKSVIINKTVDDQRKTISYVEKETIDLDNKRFIIKRQYDPAFEALTTIDSPVVNLKQ